MNELNAALYARLQGTAALTALLSGTTAIYHQQAPEGKLYPYVVFVTGGGDENLTANRTKDLLTVIRAYSENSAVQAGSIDAQVDSTLHLLPLTVGGWSNIWLARVQDLEEIENAPNGRQIFTSGGSYRIRLDKD